MLHRTSGALCLTAGDSCPVVLYHSALSGRGEREQDRAERADPDCDTAICMIFVVHSICPVRHGSSLSGRWG